MTTTTALRTDDVVAARDLRCSYGSYEAVRGVDLAVRPGELFALLGTNGAGKTTTMETLEGHRAATSGTVSLLGLDPVHDRAAVRPRVGIMLQESGFAGELTVAETVRLWLRLSSSPHAASDRRERTIADALERLDLADRADTRVVQLSGGQKRRLDLVLATVNRPEVLFLDEPTTGLDPESRERTWSLVRELRADGTTVVLTTHYLEEAERMADRLAIMHRGRIALTGTLDDVLAAQPSRITFRLPEGARGPDAERQLRLAVEPRALELDAQQTYALDTDDLQTALARLLTWAERHGHRLERLSASDASLAEVFHRISLSDDEEIA
jgi:ABC-2 type transport system ATP-binding protein